MVVLSSVGSTIGSILLFIVALSVLIVIHELGHFLVAKSFKVYCSDFSIGFGPKIIKIKRKKGETTFNVGIIPLGGYVSMYGEGIDLPDGKKIPKSRSLNGVNRWKRAAIMAAGITMNFILAYLIFLISASCFPHPMIHLQTPIVNNHDQYAKALRVTDAENKPFEFLKTDTIAANGYQVNLKNVTNLNDSLKTDKDKYVQFPGMILTYKKVVLDGVENYVFEPYTTEVTLANGEKRNVVFNYNFNTPKKAKEFSTMMTIYFANEYEIKTDENKTISLWLPEINKEGKLEKYKIDKDEELIINTAILRKEKVDGKEVVKPYDLNIKLVGEKAGKIAPLYMGIYMEEIWFGAKSFQKAGEMWVDSTTAVSKALGGLFVGKNLDQVGGPLAIFNQTTQILNEYSFDVYLNTWGVISVNLALFNLLPFPGLDGWQLLVTGIEGTANIFTRIKYRKAHEKGYGVKKNNKPENDENKSETTSETVVNETPKFTRDILKKYSELSENIKDVEKNYEFKFDKKYDHAALSNVFNDPEADYSANEEYKFFNEHNEAKRDFDEFALLNDLGDVKPYVEWGIPEKIKNIISYVGLGLLMLLAVVVLGMDIFRMF